MKTWLRYLIVFLALGISILSSCREEFEYKPTTGTLEFSKDTVFLDTIFTNIGSSTYTLKVFNSSNENILVPEIKLRNDSSSYRLNVDGNAGSSFENIPLLAKDSLFIFIETTFDISSIGENEFLYTDAIQFGDLGDFQEVELVTLVKDAIFLYPESQSNGTTETLLLGLDEEGNEIRIDGFLLDDDELTFTQEKPYVIYGYAAVSNNKTLTIEAGSRVHFHKDSGLLVGTGGSLHVLGSVSSDNDLQENEVIFQGDRLEPEFENTPGQWGTIWLAAGSTSNNIRNLTIKNATIGLLVDGDEALGTPTLSIANSQIHNSSLINLWSRAAWIQAENNVFGNAGTHSLYLNQGGNYNLKHCTIANYWTSGFRNTTALAIDNYRSTTTGERISNNLTNANFSNCIIDGNRDLEISFSREETSTFNFQFLHSSLKFSDSREIFANDPLYNFEDNSLYINTLLNTSNAFVDPVKNDFQLSGDSGVLNFGDINTALEVPLDLLGVSRTSSPDLGAFELNLP